MDEPLLILSHAAVNPQAHRTAFGTLWPLWLQAYRMHAEAYIRTHLDATKNPTELPWAFSKVDDSTFWAEAFVTFLGEEIQSVSTDTLCPQQLLLSSKILGTREDYVLAFKGYIIQAVSQYRPTNGYLLDMLREMRQPFSLSNRGDAQYAPAYKLALIAEVISLPTREAHLQNSYLEWYENLSNLTSPKTWEYCDATAKIQLTQNPIQINHHLHFGLVLYAKMEPFSFAE